MSRRTFTPTYDNDLVQKWYLTQELDGFNDSINKLEASAPAKKTTNANGSCIKYNDGKMICYKKITGNSGQPFTLWTNNIYYFDVANGDWAEDFVEIHNVQVTNNTLQLWCNIGNVTNSSAGTTRLIRPDNGGSAGQNYSINILAIGRWK